MPQIVSAMADNPVLQLKPWRHQIDIPLADRFPPGPFKGLLKGFSAQTIAATKCRCLSPTIATTPSQCLFSNADEWSSGKS